ncbi:MAG: hypothetical protein ACE5ID_06650, partial [Acidobacteriota bacterium]
MKKGLFITGIGCLSAVILVVGVVGVSLLWATLSIRSMGTPDPVPASRSIALGESHPAGNAPLPPDGSALS